MKKHSIRSAFAVGAVATVVLAANAYIPTPMRESAQSQQTPSGGAVERVRPNPPANQPGARADTLALQRFEHLKGTKLRTPQNEEIGQLDDVVIGPTGEVVYGVLSFGKIEGMAGKQYLMPWSFLQNRSPDGARFARDGSIVIAVEKERLKKAPGFDKNAWPTRKTDSVDAETDWPFGEVDKFYGLKSPTTGRVGEAAAPQRTGSILRGSEIRGRTIESADGEAIGSIAEVVLDPDNGRVSYVAVLASGSGAKDRLIAVPWSALRAGKPGPGGNDALVLPIAKNQLMAAPEFQPGDARWTEMSEPVYVQKMYDFYSVRRYWGEAPKDGERDTRPEDTRRPPPDRKDEPKQKNDPPKDD